MSYDLIASETLKAYMGIDGSQQDALLESLIRQCTALFENVCNRKFKARNYSYDPDSDDYDADNAILSGNDTGELVLPQFPVNSLTTLIVDGITIPEPSLYGRDGMIMNVFFPKGVQNVKVVYNAGYAEIPGDLEMVCIEQCAWLFKQSPAGGNLLGVSSKSLADGSVSYSARGLLPTAKEVLQKYRNRWVL